MDEDNTVKTTYVGSYFRPASCGSAPCGNDASSARRFVGCASGTEAEVLSRKGVRCVPPTARPGATGTCSCAAAHRVDGSRAAPDGPWFHRRWSAPGNKGATGCSKDPLPFAYL